MASSRIWLVHIYIKHTFIFGSKANILNMHSKETLKFCLKRKMLNNNSLNLTLSLLLYIVIKSYKTAINKINMKNIKPVGLNHVLYQCRTICAAHCGITDKWKFGISV